MGMNGVFRLNARCLPAFSCGISTLGLLLFFVVNLAHAQLRIVTYNTSSSVLTAPYTPRTGTDIVLKSIGEEQKNGISKPIDILLLQEQNRLTGLPDTQAYVDLLNTMYAGQGVTYARGNLIGGGDTTQTIVYRTETVQLLSEARVGLISGSGQPRQTLRYKVEPVGYDKTGDGLDSAAFYIYDSHYKASQGTDSGASVSNATRRNVEATNIRTDSNGLNGGADGTHIIYAGDHNFYDYIQAAEPAVQTLIAAGNGQANDPLNRIGTWHNNSSFKDIDTQSPTTVEHYPMQVTGGVDDRFDFQWTSGEMLDNAGLSYISGSYHTFGNNGTTFNLDINARNASMALINTYPFTGVTSYTNGQILDALNVIGDHLPVVADYQLPAKMSVAVGSIPARMIVGSSAQVGVTVSNSAPVAFANGADTLAYGIQGTGIVSGSASSTANPLAAGNLHNLTLSAGGTAGHQTGAVGATSTSQGAAGANFSQSIGVDVVDHSNASFSTAADANSLTIDFGQVLQGGPTAADDFTIFNRASTPGLTAGLDLDQIIATGDTGEINASISLFQNLAADPGNFAFLPPASQHRYTR